MAHAGGEAGDPYSDGELALLLARTFSSEAKVTTVLQDAGIGLEYMRSGLAAGELWTQLLRDLDRAGDVGRLLASISARHAGVAPLIAELTRKGATHTTSTGCIVVGKVPAEPATFIARETVDRLAEALESSQVAVVAAVTGMRGVGKTHIAAAYVRSRSFDDLGLVGWLDAESPQSLLDGLATIAERLRIADPDGQSERSADRLRDFLHTWNRPSLIVFDNAEDPDLVRRFVPAAGRAKVIVTAADGAFEVLGAPVRVDVYSPAESVRYLANTTGLGGGPDAEAIAEELGNLPLAIAQAAATIRDQRLGYAGYLVRLANLPVSDLLQRLPGADYPRSTAAALLMAVQGVTDELGDDALLLLRVLATLSPAGVRRDLLYTVAGPDPDPAAQAEVDAILQHCVRAAIVAWSADATVVMHRLVARLIRETAMAENVYDEVLRTSIRMLAPHLFGYWESTWHRREEGRHLNEQIESLWSAAGVCTGASEFVAEAIDARRWSYRQMHAVADTAAALQSAARLYTDCVALLGATDRRTIRAQRDYGDATRAAGDAGKAVPMLEAALRSAEDVLGQRDPDTLTCRADLGYAMRAAGRVRDAMALQEGTVTLRREVLGDDHPDTMTAVNNLAGLYRKAGRVNEAIALYEANLAKRRRILGECHQQTMFSRNNLAMAYRNATRFEDARQLIEPLVADRERILGVDHPQSMASRNDLAFTYRSLGRGAESCAIFERNFRDRVRTFGSDHPRTLVSQNNLASAYRLTGRFQEAVTLAEDVVARRTRILGQDDPKTRLSRRTLADCLLDVGRIDEAVTIMEALCAGDAARERDPETLTNLHYLGLTYTRAKRYPEAYTALRSALDGREAVLDATSVHIAHSQRRLGDVCEHLARWDDAVTLFAAALPTLTRALGPDSADVVAVREAHARLTQLQRDHPPTAADDLDPSG